MKKFIIDLHCHAFMKAYSHSFQRNGKPGFNSKYPTRKQSAWWTEYPDSDDIDVAKKSLGVNNFTQATLNQCIDGNVQVIFNALYPFEQGFANNALGSGRLSRNQIFRISGLNKKRIKYTQRLSDYYPDLKAEYNFLKQLDNQVVAVDGVKKKYHLAKNFNGLKNFLNSNDSFKKVAIVNTIEGFHSLGTGIGKVRAFQRKEELMRRVIDVKNWEHPPFFITLAHHFTNELCGHAKSFSGISNVLLNQDMDMNNDIYDLGYDILDLLLDGKQGTSVLIDVKHMSLKARISYYRFIEDSDFPIIVSHGAVTGRLNQNQSALIEGAEKKFMCKNINFYDFELIEIAESNGIFGIQFDERRSGQKKYVERHIKGKTGDDLIRGATKVIWNQIQHIAQVLDYMDLRAWDIQAIGSDFDGIVDALDGLFDYGAFMHIREPLVEHAREFMSAGLGKKFKSKNRISPGEVIDKFLSGNAWRFLEENF